MKVLITTDLYTVETNGVVTSVNNLTEELRKLGHDVRILTLSEDANDHKEENIWFVGSFSMGKVYPGIRGARKIPKEMMAELVQWGPEIIHSQCEFFPLVLPDRFRNAPVQRLYTPITHYMRNTSAI